MKPTETEKLKYAFVATMAEAAEKIPARLTKEMIEQLTASIPHIQEAGANLQEFLDDANHVWLFVGPARFYEEQSAFQEAQQLLNKGCEVVKQRFGGDHPKVAVFLSNLAQIYLHQGLYVEAKPLLEQVLRIDLSVYGRLDLEVAVDLNNLGELYREQGYYEEAEYLHIRAIAIQQNLQVTDTTDFAACLNNLALTYYAQERYNNAENLFKTAIAIVR